MRVRIIGVVVGIFYVGYVEAVVLHAFVNAFVLSFLGLSQREGHHEDGCHSDQTDQQMIQSHETTWDGCREKE